MLKTINPKIIAISIIAIIFVATISYVFYLTRPLKILKNYTIPTEFMFNNEKIALAWTDDNENETLIIQSDRKEYNGFNSVDVYFSITNISNRDQDMDVVVWVGDEKVEVERMEKINSDENQKTTSEEMVLSASAYAPLASVASAHAESGRDAQQRRERGFETKDINGFETGYSANDQIKSGQTNYYKATIKYPPMSNGEFFIEAFGGGKEAEPLRFALANRRGSASSVFAYGHLDPWYSSDWTYRKHIIIDADEVLSDEINFPVLATTTDADLKFTDSGGKVASSIGTDIVFADADGDLLNYEREYYASTTGEIAYWVKTNISSTSDTIFYMYYGNSTMSADLATTTGVWDDNYVMVNHLAHDGTATTSYPDFLDSTQYDNDGSSVNMNSDDLVDGQVDGSLDFDGLITYMSMDVEGLRVPSTLTVSTWIKKETDTLDYEGIVLTLKTTSDFGGYGLWAMADGRIRGSVDDNYLNDVDTTNIVSNNVWHYAVLKSDGTNYAVYIDGEKASADKAIVSYNSALMTVARIGLSNDAGQRFDGLIDEVRISNTARTEQWIATEYNNQVDVDTFLTYGAEENATSTEFVSKIRAAGNNGDFINLSSWEDDVECDLTATTTRVYSGSITGSIATSSTVELFRDGTYLNITANVLATSTGGQILVDNITGASYDLVAQSGDQWRFASSTDNMWTITGTTGDELGDTVIAVAECYNDWPSGLEDYVTITGWTTNATNYVKVYAPSGQRHDGTFGTGFTLMNTTINYISLITVYEQYSVFDGLTLHQNKINAYSGIYISGSAGKGAVVKNCIFYAETAATNAIASAYAVSPLPVMANNIIYGNWSMGIYVYSGILYNNTIIGVSGRGIRLNYDYFHPIAKNNIVINNSGGDYRYTSSFDGSSSNNISSDDTAPGTGSLTNQTLSNMAFVSTESGSEDFHLQISSIAKNIGTNLSSDSDYAVTDDIDYQTRLGAWDIGADEFNEITHLIRKTYTIDSSSGDIARSSNVVTVNLTTEHDNLVVGQTIKVWDVDDSTFDGYFAIASVASTTQFTYAQTGDDANSANGSVGGDYELLSTWEAAQERDLVTAQQIEVVECYNDWKTTGLDDSVTIDGWTTSADYYVKIYTLTSERHDGWTWTDTNKNVFSGFALVTDASYAAGITVMEGFTKIDGIIFNMTGYAGKGILFHTGGDGVAMNCIAISSDNSADTSGFYSSGSTGRANIFINCLAYDLGYGFYITDWDIIYMYNCTAVDCLKNGFLRSGGNSSHIMKNCLANGNGVKDFSFSSYGSSSTNNASSDGTADDHGGTGNRVNQTFTFVDETNDDFHLASTDIGARNQGTDLSADDDYPFTDDIDGDTRPYNGLWDIGADEASGYAGVQPNSPYTDNGNWYNANWKYKRAIVLEADQISTTTDAFPVLATTTLSDLKSYAYDGNVGNSNGYDIIFVDDDNTTLLNFEREYYDPATGEIAYWIKTDISSTTDKTIYMYYGNASALDLATTTGIWDDNYVMVQHLQETPDNTAGQIKDSTSNDNDGQTVTMTSSDQVAGQIDGSLDFDGGDDYISVADTSGDINNSFHRGNTNFTVSGIYTPHQVSSPGSTQYNSILQTYKDGGNYIQLYHLNNWGTNSITFFVYDSYAGKYVGTGVLSLTIDVPIFLQVAWDGTNAIFYMDGVLASSTPLVQTDFPDTNLANTKMGFANTDYLYGLIDEVRLSNIARHAMDVLTDYNNQLDVDAFMTFGSEESLNRKAQVNSPITNYFTDGLVGHWTFNGPDMDWSSSTAEVLDMSGNSNNGNVIGAKAVIGKVGQGLEFDGSDDYVAVVNNMSSFKTVSAWVNVDVLDTTPDYIFAHNNFRILKMASDSKYPNKISLADVSGSDIFSTNAITANTWYHIVGIKDGVDKKIYINGIFNTELDYEEDVASNVVNLGRYTDGTGHFDGLIDEVRIYNRALSADEIGQLYRAGARKMEVN